MMHYGFACIVTKLNPELSNVNFFFFEGFPKPEMKVVINGSVIILHQQDFPKYCQATGNGNGKGHGNPFPEDDSMISWATHPTTFNHEGVV